MLNHCVLACVLSFQAIDQGRDFETFKRRVAEFGARTKALEAARGSDARGQAALDWLQALKAVLAAIPIARTNDLHRQWLDAHDNLVVYSEPAGQWLIQDALIWKTHDEHRGAAAADDIAWLGATNGLPGECEGYVPCYAFGLNHLEGEYLRRHPNGRHRGEALGQIAASLKSTLDDLLVRYPDFLKVPADCEDLLHSAIPLREAVDSVAHANTAATLVLIDRLIARCPAR